LSTILKKRTLSSLGNSSKASTRRKTAVVYLDGKIDFSSSGTDVMSYGIALNGLEKRGHSRALGWRWQGKRQA
jgi:hypothetical protein